MMGTYNLIILLSLFCYQLKNFHTKKLKKKEKTLYQFIILSLVIQMIKN